MPPAPRFRETRLKVLVVGGGGREHALVRSLAGSPLVAEVWAAPGNPGMGPGVRRLPLAPDAVDDLAGAAAARDFDLVVVGAEAPLVAGLADRLRARNVAVVGPGAREAVLEGSKVAARALAREVGVPVPRYRVFDDVDAARRHVRAEGGPLVVKADGLAGGKGSFVCSSTEEALDALDRLMVRRVFGEAGARVLVEERLVGVEASVMVLTDGVEVLPLPVATDYKRLADGDVGPNTGGMGAVAPTPVLDEAAAARVREQLILPILAALAERGRLYRGFLYAGVMLTAGGPVLLELNVRPGDPEAQAVLPLLADDPVPALLAVARGSLAGAGPPRTLPGAAVAVVLACAGYPGPVEAPGGVIAGLSPEELGWGRGPGRGPGDGPLVFAGGVGEAAGAPGRLTALGGRVLTVTGRGRDIAEASAEAYAAAEGISFQGRILRRDIGRTLPGGCRATVDPHTPSPFPRIPSAPRR